MWIGQRDRTIARIDACGLVLRKVASRAMERGLNQKMCPTGMPVRLMSHQSAPPWTAGF